MPEGILLHEAMNVVARATVARDVAAAITWALSTATPAAEFAARLAVAEAGGWRRARTGRAW
jgi:hypothetical protein